MRLCIIPCLFAPLLVSADSEVAARERAAGFVGGAFDESLRYARDKYIFGAESSLDFTEWLAARGAVSLDDAVVSPFLRRGETFAEGLSFVRDVEVRYESPLGGRQGNFGVGVLGSLRESADDVVVWELRGFVGEDDVAGANVGAAYRRLVADNFLAGVNLFLDYERGGDRFADESFWRWSAGVEATGAHLDFSANRYWALSDAVMATVGGVAYRVYSADGWDAELRGRVAVRYPVAFRFLDSAEVAARYYVWEGDGGGTGADGDVSGARYRFGFVPLPQLRFGVEYDSGDGGGKHFGYYVNFRHRLGGASDSLARDDGADVWSRRFDPVRREHQQHIMRTQVGAGVVTSVEIFLSSVTANMAVLTLSSYFPAGAGYSYAVVSANPPGWTNSVSVDTNTGVVTDSGAKNATGGGTVYFSVSDSAGGVSLEFTVFFRDLSLAVSNADADDKVRFFFSDLSASDVLTVSVGGTATSLTYAIESATPSSWRGLLSINKDSGVVNYTGGATENGEVVFSVTDNDTGAAVLLTVRFGGLSFADVSVTVHSLQTSATVTTLMASGGSGAVVYEAVSFNPMNASVSLMVVGDKLIDNGLAAGGAATATMMVVATDAAGFMATAAVVVEVLDALSIAGSVDVLITPGNAGMPIATLTAMGGDGDYTYAFVSTNPPDWQAASLVLTASVVSDAGAFDEGPRLATAVFSATDGIGAMTVFVTAYIEVVESATFVSDNFTLTLTPGDTGALLTLSVLVGGGSHVFATASSTPGTFANLLMVTENANSNFVVSDNGAVAGGDATGEVVYSLADSGNTDFATVHIRVLDGLTLAEDDFMLTLRPGDANSNVANLVASGGDGVYSYRLVSTNPAVWGGTNNSLSIDGNGAITDSGLAAGGAAQLTAVFAVNDDYGLSASATLDIVVAAAFAMVADEITLTISSADSGDLATLAAMGGIAPYTFAVDAPASTPPAWAASLAIDNNSGIISDAGAAANRADTATVEYTVTDAGGEVVRATVEIIAVADLAIANSSVSLALDFDDAGAEVVTLSVTGGASPLSYAVVSSNPDETLFAIDSNGVISEAGLVTVGGAGTVVFSVTDALNRVVNATVEFSYTAVKFTGRNAHASAVLNGRMFVIAGNSGASRLANIWSSPDGVNWTQETSAPGFSGRSAPAATALGGSLFVIGGNDGNNRNDVWSSTDGATWVQVTSAAAFPARSGHAAMVLGGTLFVIGGIGAGNTRYSDVWHSTDGANWTQSTANAGFSPRNSFASAVSGGAMYVIAGFPASSIPSGEVWSSTDGASWTQQTSSSALPGRNAPAATALNGTLYVIAGQDDTFTVSDDVYSSTDGASWTLAADTPGFAARNFHQAVALNNRIYILGGNGVSSGNVWSSADGITWTQH